MSLMLKNGTSSYDEVAAIIPPDHTDTWFPIKYSNAIDAVESRIAERLPNTVIDREFGMAKKNSQIFALWTLGCDHDGLNMKIGMRGSIDKSLAWGVIGGAGVFVCDNLMFTGGDYRTVRKNTRFVWDDFRNIVDDVVLNAPNALHEHAAFRSHTKQRAITHERGFELLGRAVGHKVLKPTQANIAFKDWRDPRHDEFSDHDLWSLYNCMTEGAKSGAIGGAIERHTRIHEFIQVVAEA